jgi:TRAP-type C4-dicarboxylate transport system permease small subunit
MRDLLHSVSRFLDRMCRMILWISGAGLFVMTMVVAWQVWGRFVLNNSPTWTEPTSLMLMLWFIFLAAAVGVRQRFHLSLDLVRQLVPARVNAVMDTLSFTVVGIFGAAMIWYTRVLIAQTWEVHIPGLGLPAGLAYLSIAVSGALIVVFSIEHLLKMFFDARDAQSAALVSDDLVALADEAVAKARLSRESTPSSEHLP